LGYWWPAPTKLVVKDLKTGDGAEAKSGDQVSVQYVGVLYGGGKQFDSSWDRGQPFSFQLGGGGVIPG
jgi:peptidylprolyl isomerase